MICGTTWRLKAARARTHVVAMRDFVQRTHEGDVLALSAAGRRSLGAAGTQLGGQPPAAVAQDRRGDPEVCARGPRPNPVDHRHASAPTTGAEPGRRLSDHGGPHVAGVGAVRRGATPGLCRRSRRRTRRDLSTTGRAPWLGCGGPRRSIGMCAGCVVVSVAPTKRWSHGFARCWPSSRSGAIPRGGR